MRTTTIRLLTLTLLGGILTACGGGGGSSSAPASQAGANQPPEVRVTFPNAYSLTNKATIIVRGTANDPDGDSIEFVRVNGVDAVSDDGFANWEATVPLGFGENILTVTAADSEQNPLVVQPSIRVLQQSVFFPFPAGAVVDEANNELFIADRRIPAVVAIDLETNERRIVSRNEEGDAFPFQDPSDIALVPAGACASFLPTAVRCLVVLDHRERAVFVVDADSGERVILSGGEGGNEVGAGPAFSSQAFHMAGAGPEFCPASLADRFANCALVMENFGLVKVVDLATGERVPVLQNAVVDSPNFVRIHTLVVDDNSTCATVLPDSNQCLIAVDPRLNAVLAVDLDTGERAVLSGSARGNGPELNSPKALVLLDASHCTSVLPSATRCAFVTNESERNVFAIDLTSGDRALLSSADRGVGPNFSFIDELIFDPVNQRVLAIDEDRDSPIVIDSVTGDRSFALDHQIGSGPELKDTSGLSPLNNAQCETILGSTGIPCAFIIDESTPQLLAINLATGDRIVISDDQRGEGPSFRRVLTAIVDEGNSCASLLLGVSHCALMMDTDDRLFVVDLENGDRAVLSETLEDTQLRVGRSAAIAEDCSAIVAGATRCVLIVSRNNGGLFAIDLTTGSRSVISDSTRGDGTNFDFLAGILVDENNHCADVLPEANVCALGIDTFSDPDASVIAVDLETGDRAAFSADSRGEGPSLNLPLGISAADEAFCQTHLSSDACILVLDEIIGALFAIDLATGDRTIIFQDADLFPRAAVIDDSSSDLLFMLDVQLHGIITVDLKTGERAATAWSGLVNFESF